MTQVHPIIFNQIPELTSLKGGYPNIETFLFDMDGTLFDTEKFHALALKEIGNIHSIKPPLTDQEIYDLMVGKADHLLFDIIKDWPGFPAHWTAQDFVQEKNTLLLKILRSVKSDLFFPQEMKKLLKDILRSKYNLGLVTSSEKIITHELLQIAGIYDDFQYILTRDDSLRVKPDPWPYLHAINYFKSDSHQVLIFEDSLVGIEAARHSNAHVIKAEWY